MELIIIIVYCGFLSIDRCSKGGSGRNLWALKLKNTIAIMESKRMWQKVIMPPLLHLAWKAGLKIPPLPFASFWQITLLMGGWFGPAWDLYVVLLGRIQGYNRALHLSQASSQVFVLVFLWLRIIGGEVVNNLPDWDSLG